MLTRYSAVRGEVEADRAYTRDGRASRKAGKVTKDSPVGTAFGPKRLSANTSWSSPISTTLLQRVP
jgi:hypothetical protein